MSSAFLFFCENLIIFLTVVGNILKFAMHTVESLEFVFRGIHGYIALTHKFTSLTKTYYKAINFPTKTDTSIHKVISLQISKKPQLMNT